MSDEGHLRALAGDARLAAREMAGLTGAQRNAALASVRAALVAARPQIEQANRADKADAAKANLDASLLKRLDLEGPKFDGMLDKLDEVRKLDDPLNSVSYAMQLDDGLELYRTACPIGVICVIFESRPESAVQIAALTLKSANSLILKGGKEASKTNRELIVAIRAGLQWASIPVASVQLVETRSEVGVLLGLHDCIDLVVPRGSNALVSSIMSSTRIPVMGHADGICSIYIDSTADKEVAIPVVVDSKTDYPVACNSVETLLIHESLLKTLWPELARKLLNMGITIKADELCVAALRFVGFNPDHNTQLQAATLEDFRTEFGGLTLAVKAVTTTAEAIEHINTHGSHHTDCIVSSSPTATDLFLQMVDSAGVYSNASTRFADGQRYGFGAEVGVSTNRIHSRGPMGVEGLLTYKYRLFGDGHVASAYGSGAGKKGFSHVPLLKKMPSRASVPQASSAPLVEQVKHAAIFMGSVTAALLAGFALGAARKGR